MEKCRALKLEKAWRMGEEKHSSQNRSEKCNQSTGKESKEVFSVNFANFKKGSQKLLLPLESSHLCLNDPWQKSQRREQTLFPASIILGALDLILCSGKLKKLKWVATDQRERME